MRARAAMHKAAVLTGMVNESPVDSGGSIHPLLLVLEPEAASIFCLNRVANPEAQAMMFVDASLRHAIKLCSLL